MRLNEVFTEGKHKGKSLKKVIREDQPYIVNHAIRLDIYGVTYLNKNLHRKSIDDTFLERLFANDKNEKSGIDSKDKKISSIARKQK